MNELTSVKDQSRALAPSSQNTALMKPDDQVFVTFYVRNQLFGIPVERVQDILSPEKIANIPLSPPEVAGTINLRGRIVTVIDVAARLGLPPKEDRENAMCVTIEKGNELYSMMADTVGNVLTLPQSDIEPNPTTMLANWRSVSVGVVRLQGELMLILDVDALLSFGC
ncbi:chemotaxis protein CheW [Phaeovibrio sulfidiphilus]|uniref:Chemotaxis protein CheW n=1 Tax=Phaeovibrio sulfidiphilus TaxID=1220600 RepID=A0A8J6YLX8_9PROT|nr:chemotaxis protein CheW [Phaeovibrio sulfidiphilus]MBE1237033.1 chemotaxis protein CheW [Phaeovibrio sulfidiphilus]